MLTLEQINLTEEELSQMLNFIYESEDHPEKAMYAQFIEDATLEQKLGLTATLMMEARDASGAKVRDPNKQGHIKKGAMSMLGQAGGLGVFWLAYRVIRALTDKCSRKCKVIGTNTFIRQKCMAGCDATEAAKAGAAVAKIKCGSGDTECETKKKGLAEKWRKKAAEASAKAKRYAEKHKKLAYTV